MTDEEIAAFDAKLAAEFRALREERDALRALVECATAFRFGDYLAEEGDAYGVWFVAHWDGKQRVFITTDTRDNSIAKARALAKEDT